MRRRESYKICDPVFQLACVYACKIITIVPTSEVSLKNSVSRWMMHAHAYQLVGCLYAWRLKKMECRLPSLAQSLHCANAAQICLVLYIEKHTATYTIIGTTSS